MKNKKQTLHELQACIKELETGNASSSFLDALETTASSEVNKFSSGLKKSTTMNKPEETDFENLKDHSKKYPSEKETKKKVERLCLYREQHSKLLKERLLREGYNEVYVDTAIQWALRYGLINDMRYAEVLIRTRVSAGKGMAGIVRELEDLKIDFDAIEGWPEEFGLFEERELERALNFLKRRPTRSKRPRDAAYAKLRRKGYSSSISAEAARIWSNTCR